MKKIIIIKIKSYRRSRLFSVCSTEVDTYLREKRERERERGAFVCSISLACVFDKSTSIPVGCSSFFPSTILSRAAKWSRSQSRESFDFSALETKVCTYCVVYKLHTYSHPTVPFFTTLLATHLQIPTWKKKKKQLIATHTERDKLSASTDLTNGTFFFFF